MNTEDDDEFERVPTPAEELVWQRWRDRMSDRARKRGHSEIDTVYEFTISPGGNVKRLTEKGERK